MEIILSAENAPAAWTDYCRGDVPQEVVLDWLKRHILERLQLDKPPELTLQSPSARRVHVATRNWARRIRREAECERRQYQEISQVILFPSSEDTCLEPVSESSEDSPSHYTFYFQPSLNNQKSIITSVEFWFYVGESIAINTTSVPLYILTAHQGLMQLALTPSKCNSDGWSTYRIERYFHSTIAHGPFLLQVRCPSCYSFEEDKIPFLHIQLRPRGPERMRRAPSIAWSPAVIEKLQRPSPEKDDTYCKREQIEISFEKLGWDNWIVHPKTFSFYYCHGNCSNPELTATLLGLRQCCAPVPESMRSLRFTTTSDGGFSFKYETLPNIIPEECNCI